MKTYSFEDLSSATLAEVAVLRHQPMQPAVWEELARRELGEHDRAALGFVVEKLLYYKTVRANEATIWARAIYPLLALAERDEIRAFSAVPLVARFDEVELRGKADGALAESVDEELGLPYLVVVEAKRGVGATDPMAQLLGAMLCAARLNELGGHPLPEIYGCYTVADVWTFLRGTLDWTAPKLTMSVLSSREYTEKAEAPLILSILASIVVKLQR
jgi:hypothetical protein